MSDTTLQRLNPDTIAPPVGLYSQGVATPGGGRWLHIAGQVGLRRDGTLGVGFEAQATAAWENVVGVLAAAGMAPGNLVKVTTFLTDAGHLPQFGAVRAKFLGDARPASTLLIVAALARPEWLVEVEAVAWKA